MDTDIEIKDRRSTSAGEFFSVSIAGTIIRDCKLVSSSKGEFVSGPARKDNDGKWWPQVKFSEDHQRAIKAALKGEDIPKMFDDGEIPF